MYAYDAVTRFQEVAWKFVYRRDNKVFGSRDCQRMVVEAKLGDSTSLLFL